MAKSTVQISRNSLIGATANASANNLSLIDAVQTGAEKKIDLSGIEKSLSGNGEIQVLSDGKLEYNAFDKGITDASPIVKNSNEVAEDSLEFLIDSGLILSGDYVVTVVPVKKIQLDDSTFEEISSSVIEYEVYVESKNSPSADKNIFLQVQADGIVSMSYNWGVGTTK